MAILPLVPGLTVTISTASGPLVEYTDPYNHEDDDKTCVRYIEAQSGATFKVCWAFDNSVFPHPAYCVAARIHLDGKYAAGPLVDPADRVRYPTDFREGVENHDPWTNTWFRKKFLFAELTIGETEKTGALSMTEYKELGEIRVTWRFCAKQGLPGPRARKIAFDTRGSTVMQEKKLKGRDLSHCADLGPAEPTQGRTCTAVTYPFGEEPFATFRFRYRCKRALQACLILPRTPSPVPLSERPIEDLSPEELRERLRQSESEKSRLTRIKLERKRKRGINLDSNGDSDVDDDVQLQKTRSCKAGGTSHALGAEPEIVDLTED